MPDFLSPACQDLITLILNPEPSKRFTIQDICAHPWYNQIEHQPPYTPSVFIGKEPIPVDEKILATLQKDYNLESSKVIDEIQRNRFNDYTTTYYLLFKRKERAAIFRQQYNDEVKKLLRRKKGDQSEVRPKEVLQTIPVISVPLEQPEEKIV